jgi:small conductance mechanosensitive channel
MASDPGWKGVILEVPRVERVESIDEMGITLKILGTIRAPEQWAASGEFRKRLLAAFAEHGIEIPRPHRVVFTGEGGTATLPSTSPTEQELSDE